MRISLLLVTAMLWSTIGAEGAADPLDRLSAIAKNAPPYRSLSFDAEILRVFEDEVLASYDAMAYEAAWTADCRAFLVEMGRFYAKHADALTAAELGVRADHLARSGCSDPYFRYAQGRIQEWVGSKEQSLQLLHASVHSMVASRYPAFRRFYHVFSTIRMGTANEKFSDQWYALYRQTGLAFVSGPELVGKENFLISIFLEDHGNLSVKKEMNRLNALLLQAIPDDSWIKPACTAAHHIDMAWQLRGRGFAKTVTEEGWQGFRDNLEIAYQAALKGIEDDRARLRCATSLITISLGHEQARERVFDWFTMALESDFNASDPYEAMEAFLLPRWHGSMEGQLAFALMLANTRRYDTLAAVEAVDMVGEILADANCRKDTAFAPKFLSLPVVDQLLCSTLAGILAEPNMAPFHPWAQTWCCGIALQKGDLAVARQAYREAGSGFRTTILEHYYPDLWREMGKAVTSP